uniref:Uncharacterized protein n=1 Tax=Arundo donax TaxID=35708 RepID=A0A0A8ZAR7_ARUDO
MVLLLLGAMSIHLVCVGFDHSYLVFGSSSMVLLFC